MNKILLILFILLSSTRAQVLVLQDQAPVIPAAQAAIYKEVLALMDSAPEKALLKIKNLKEASVVFGLIEGIILKKQKKFAKAESVFKRTLKVAPSFYQARMNLATLYLEQDKTADALPQLLKIVQLGRADGWVWQNMAYCFREAGKYQAAEEALRQTRLYQVESSVIDKSLMNLKLLRKDYTAALILAQELVDLDSSDRQSWQVMIDCLQQLEKPALQDMVVYAKLFELSDSEQQRLAGMYFNEGLYADAARIYLRVKGELAPESRLQSAQCYLLIEQYAKALEVLTPAKYSSENMARFMEFRAAAFTGLQQSERALVELLKALKYDTQNGRIHFRIAVIYEEQGKRPQALDFYGRAAKDKALTVPAQLRKARLYALNKEYSLALEEAQKALAIEDSLSTRSFIIQLEKIINY